MLRHITLYSLVCLLGVFYCWPNFGDIMSLKKGVIGVEKFHIVGKSGDIYEQQHNQVLLFNIYIH